MRIVFFGIFNIGTEALERLVANGFEIAVVVTKPDTENQRQPVAVAAERLGLSTLQVPQVKAPSLCKKLAAHNPDLIVVSGFHQRLPPELLLLPTKAAINSHLSMLPSYRGPVPYKWAIINGETTAGATVHMMTERFDEGDIIGQASLQIADDDTADRLLDRLCTLAADLLVNTVQDLQNGTITRHSQDEALASYHPNLTDADTRIDWSMDALAIDRRVRGLTRRPGAWFYLDGHRMQVKRTRILGHRSGETPGTVLARGDETVMVATGSMDMAIDYVCSMAARLAAP